MPHHNKMYPLKKMFGDVKRHLSQKCNFFREDCEHFSLNTPDVSLATDTLRNLEECSVMWELYEDFQQGLDENAEQDWISFRSEPQSLKQQITSGGIFKTVIQIFRVFAFIFNKNPVFLYPFLCSPAGVRLTSLRSFCSGGRTD